MKNILVLYSKNFFFSLDIVGKNSNHKLKHNEPPLQKLLDSPFSPQNLSEFHVAHASTEVKYIYLAVLNF